MPEITGIDFLKIIRSKGDSTPIIIFTAVGREHAAIEALNNGANFFLKKGEDPRMQFREMVAMVKRAVEQNSIGRSLGTSERIISEIINFSSDPSFAIDREGKVVAWNDSMEHLTDVPASAMMGKGDYAYAEPFFGTRKKMLVDLVFEPDEEIRNAKYMLVNRVTKGMIIAVTQGKKKDGGSWTLWAKAKPIYDSHGNFIAVVCTVRDVTATFGDVPLPEGPGAVNILPSQSDKARAVSEPVKGLIKKMLGRALSHYKEGVGLYVRERNFSGAIEDFRPGDRH